jgi:hypothetical protein
MSLIVRLLVRAKLAVGILQIDGVHEIRDHIALSDQISRNGGLLLAI